MKKTLIRFALASGVLLIGCKDAEKQNDVSPLVSSTNARVENGRIVFNEDFYTTLLDSSNKDARKAVESLDKSSEFTSLNEFGNDATARKNYRVSGTAAFSEAELDNYPDFIKNILNPDGVVEIGNNIIRINLVKEKVYVLNKKHIDSYNDLLAENVSNKKILVFSTDQEVLSELKKVQNGRTDLLCFSESGAPSLEDKGMEEFPGFNNLSLRMDNKVVYQKAGIYFSLQSKIKLDYKNSLGLWANIDGVSGISYQYQYKPKCKSEISRQYGESKPSGATSEHNFRPYESASTALHKLYFSCTFLAAPFKSARNYTINHRY